MNRDEDPIQVIAVKECFIAGSRRRRGSIFAVPAADYPKGLPSCVVIDTPEARAAVAAAKQGEERRAIAGSIASAGRGAASVIGSVDPQFLGDVQKTRHMSEPAPTPARSKR